jgi:hypothetical protein
MDEDDIVEIHPFKKHKRVCMQASIFIALRFAFTLLQFHYGLIAISDSLSIYRIFVCLESCFVSL